MIYEFPNSTASLRQGDLFRRIPRLELSLERVCVLENDNQVTEASWDSISAEAPNVIVGIVPVWAIVITQDCDTLRSPDISLCEVRQFSEVVRVTQPASPKGWTSLICTQTVMNLKWFYLPPSERIGFRDRMAVDFQSTLRVQRQELENLRHFRVGRLNDTADEHFRERLSEFFRRYPYNEWYPLNKEEFEAYRSSRPESAETIKPYPYQL